MSMHVSPKDPAAIRDIVIDWQQWLDTGDTIATSVFTASNVTIVSQSNTTRYSYCRISGGTVDIHAELKNVITTTDGESQPVRIVVPIEYE
jgi:hypothetical protein